MGERAPLGVLGIGHERRGSGLGLRQVLRLPGVEVGGLQLFKQLAQAQGSVKLPAGACGDPVATLQIRVRMRGHFRTAEQFAGADAGQPLRQFVEGTLGQVDVALRDTQPGQATARSLGCAWTDVHGQQHGLLPFVQQLRVGERAGGDHAHHLALHRPLATDFAHLFANGDRFAELDQASEVTVHRVKWHTGHHHRLTGRLAALRQGDVQQPCRFLGVVKKQLVEISHAVEHQRGGEVCLDAQVLGHHGGVLRQVSCRHGCLQPSSSAARPFLALWRTSSTCARR